MNNHLVHQQELDILSIRRLQPQSARRHVTSTARQPKNSDIKTDDPLDVSSGTLNSTIPWIYTLPEITHGETLTRTPDFVRLRGGNVRGIPSEGYLYAVSQIVMRVQCVYSVSVRATHQNRRQS